MNAGNLWLLIKLLPLLATTAILFGLFGWWLRRKFHAPVVASNKPAAPDDLPARDRVKKLEHALAKSETAKLGLKQDLETLQAKSISKATYEKAARELSEAQHRVEADLKRIQMLETELKKSRDAVNTLNSNAAEANKGQRERTFALENELSKTREALAVYQSRPDNTLALQAEVDRLREALTNSTRVIGELRKQESAAVEAMTKAQKKLDAALAKSTYEETGTVSLFPAMDLATRKQPKPVPALEPTDKVADAKAEVERILAMNSQKEAERLAAEQAAAQQKAEQEHLAAERATAQKAEQERLAAEQAAARQQAELERLAAERAAVQQQAELERLAAEQAAAQKVAEERPAVEQASSQAAQDLLAALEKPLGKPLQPDLFATQEIPPTTDESTKEPV